MPNIREYLHHLHIIQHHPNRENRKVRDRPLGKFSRNIAKHDKENIGTLNAGNYALWNHEMCTVLGVWVVYIPRESIAF